ncbi:hypothetical protein ACWDYH_31405 [Nocardia goodfellowii]
MPRAFRASLSALSWLVTVEVALAWRCVGPLTSFSQAEEPAFICTGSNTAAEVTGAGPGGTGSGPRAILGFEHAFYLTRSAAAMARFIALGSALLERSDRLQAVIDATPLGTRHCVRIQPVDSRASWWAVTITEFDVTTTTSRVMNEIITTAAIGGHILVDAVDVAA